VLSSGAACVTSFVMSPGSLFIPIADNVTDEALEVLDVVVIVAGVDVVVVTDLIGVVVGLVVVVDCVVVVVGLVVVVVGCVVVIVVVDVCVVVVRKVVVVVVGSLGRPHVTVLCRPLVSMTIHVAPSTLSGLCIVANKMSML
jgi:hypothetical protein